MNFVPLLTAVLMTSGVVGGGYVESPSPQVTTPYLSVAAGAFDTFDNSEQDSAADFRLEYRPGLVLYQQGIVTVQPFVGVEGTTDGSFYGLGGITADVQYGDWYMTPSFAMGAYYSGNGKNMGSPLEFRTQIEAGYEFDNQARLGLAVSHISNANIADTNPGVEVISVYYHHPVNWLK